MGRGRCFSSISLLFEFRISLALSFSLLRTEGIWCHPAVSKSTAGQASRSGDERHRCPQLSWQVPREVCVAIRHMTVALAMFWKQEFVWLAVRARALPAVRAGGRECRIHCRGLSPAEEPAIARKNPINSNKMQRRKVREESRVTPAVRTVLQSLLRLPGVLHSLGTLAKCKQTGAELTQPHPG